ncbi:hypothetical protein Bca4012_020406 [Brassica carinata]
MLVELARRAHPCRGGARRRADPRACRARPESTPAPGFSSPGEHTCARVELADDPTRVLVELARQAHPRQGCARRRADPRAVRTRPASTPAPWLSSPARSTACWSSSPDEHTRAGPQLYRKYGGRRKSDRPGLSQLVGQDDLRAGRASQASTPMLGKYGGRRKSDRPGLSQLVGQADLRAGRASRASTPMLGLSSPGS